MAEPISQQMAEPISQQMVEKIDWMPRANFEVNLTDDTFCFFCFSGVPRGELGTHSYECAKRRTDAKLYLKPVPSTSSKSARSRPSMGLCTFQTPGRPENCSYCSTPVLTAETAAHLFDCVACPLPQPPRDTAVACELCKDEKTEGILKLSNCEHYACQSCLMKHIKPSAGPARLAINQRCSACRAPIHLSDLVQIAGEKYVFALFYTALHEIVDLECSATAGFDCPACGSHQEVSKSKAQKRTFKSAAGVLTQKCACGTKVCLACEAATNDGSDVHPTIKSICLQARLFVALQGLSHLSKYVGISPDEDCEESRDEKTDSQMSEVTSQTSHQVWGAGTGYGSSYDAEGYFDDNGDYHDPSTGMISSSWVSKAEDLKKVDLYVADIFRMLTKPLVTTDEKILPPAFAFLFGASSLVQPLIRSYLRNDSFDDICNRQPLYRALFEFIGLLSSFPVLQYILTKSPNASTPSIMEMMRNLQEKLPRFLSIVEDGEEKTFLKNYLEAIPTFIVPAEEGTSMLNMMAASSSQPAVDYQALMKPYQFAESTEVLQSKQADQYAVTAPSRGSLRRLARELDGVISDSFITSGKTSILVRVDKTRLNVWRALITAPSDTPYSYGCFEFDIAMTSDFPKVPPKVVGLTTGNETVSFNPNHYNNGYVCLTILGTWGGSPSEMWNPEVSSLAQVLISIQSFIFGSAVPYYNEPGYESSYSPDQARDYNDTIVVETLRWAIVDQLKNPHPDFAEAIKTHLRACRTEIDAYYRNYYRNPPEFAAKQNYESYIQNVDALLEEFHRLLD